MFHEHIPYALAAVAAVCQVTTAGFAIWSTSRARKFERALRLMQDRAAPGCRRAHARGTGVPCAVVAVLKRNRQQGMVCASAGLRECSRVDATISLQGPRCLTFT